MSPVFKWTLRQRRWSVVWWSIGIIAFIFINLIFYPTFKSQSAQFNKTFEQLPETARQLFTDTGDFFSPVGYLSSQLFYLMLPLLLGFLAISLGVSLIGKEEREGTLEMLLARPISRTRLILSKTAAGALILLAVGIISTLTIMLMCKLVDINAGSINIFEAGLVVTLMAACFGAVAFLVTMLGQGVRAAAIGVATLVALGGYILVSLSGTVTWLAWPAKLFPFNYYHSSDLLTGSYDWANLIFFIVMIALCGLGSWASFRRRDIGE